MIAYYTKSNSHMYTRTCTCTCTCIHFWVQSNWLACNIKKCTYIRHSSSSECISLWNGNNRKSVVSSPIHSQVKTALIHVSYFIMHYHKHCTCTFDLTGPYPLVWLGPFLGLNTLLGMPHPPPRPPAVPTILTCFCRCCTIFSYSNMQVGI